jgi:hypothetical protein
MESQEYTLTPYMSPLRLKSILVGATSAPPKGVCIKKC